MLELSKFDCIDFCCWPCGQFFKGKIFPVRTFWNHRIVTQLRNVFVFQIFEFWLFLNYSACWAAEIQPQHQLKPQDWCGAERSSNQIPWKRNTKIVLSRLTIPWIRRVLIGEVFPLKNCPQVQLQKLIQSNLPSSYMKGNTC